MRATANSRDFMLIFKVDFLGHAVKVTGWITGEGIEVRQLSRNAFEGGVSKVFRENTPSRAKHLYQAATNRLVFLAGALRMRTKPTEKPFERFCGTTYLVVSGRTGNLRIGQRNRSTAFGTHM